MMPKGVEHIGNGEQPQGHKAGVKIPMMPKGVEHSPTIRSITPSGPREDSNDAERR